MPVRVYIIRPFSGYFMDIFHTSKLHIYICSITGIDSKPMWSCPTANLVSPLHPLSVGDANIIVVYMIVANPELAIDLILGPHVASRAETVVSPPKTLQKTETPQSS